MMNPQRAGILRSPAVRWAAILVGLLGFIAALTILVHAALNENTIEADFYTFWMAGRSFFLEHQNPYSQDVTTQTQLGVYGRPAQGTEDHLGYAYPAYNLLPLLPFVLMDFPWASAAWLAFNLVLLVVALVAAAPKMPKLAVITLPFFYPFAFCLLLGNYPILLALAVILFFWHLHHKRVAFRIRANLARDSARLGQLQTAVYLAPPGLCITIRSQRALVEVHRQLPGRAGGHAAGDAAVDARLAAPMDCAGD